MKTQLLLIVVLAGCCDPVGLDNKVQCHRDSEGLVWTDNSMMQKYEKHREQINKRNLCYPDEKCSHPHPDVLPTKEDTDRWCLTIR